LSFYVYDDVDNSEKKLKSLVTLTCYFEATEFNVLKMI